MHSDKNWDLYRKWQFYPTSQSLADKAWEKFKNRNFTKILDPSAGDGALLNPHWKGHRYALRDVDVVEIDMDKHPLLREKGANVVGLDFLTFEGGSYYSHIIMNPPFNQGANHVLHAWEILFDGEIVAILNKETISNPYTKERRMLVDLIEKHGEVEFMTEAFMSEDTLRKTNVEIALVYMRKQSLFMEDLAGDIMEDLRTEKEQDHGLGYEQENQLALKNSTIENLVIAFKAATIANRQQVFAMARAAYYRNILGSTMERMHSNFSTEETTIKWVTQTINEMYLDLKNRAWANVLRSSDVLSKLSSSAQKTVEKEFENIKKLEFSKANIYGFLLGILEKQGDIQNEMILNCFESITRYHSQNTVYYLGWLSNNKHRTAGMRIKMSRIVLPYFRIGFSGQLEWEAMQKLRDYDKTFELLNGQVIGPVEQGKPLVEGGLEDVFQNHITELRSGERISSKYFDVRYYPGRATMHLFPTDKKLIERFNIRVGRLKAWLPEFGSGNDEFMAHYEDAEKFDKEIQTELKNRKDQWRFGNVTYYLDSKDEHDRKRANDYITGAVSVVLERRGYNIQNMLTENKPLQLTA